MKKLIFPLIAIVLLVSCSDLTDMNDNPERPAQVPANPLFSNAEKNLVDFLSSTDVNVNVFKLFAQYWTETTYIDESDYDITTRAIPDEDWQILYVDVIKDLNESAGLIENDDALDAAVKQNKLACIEVLKVYAYSELVNTFGDIPYSEVLDIDNTTPKFDDAATVYEDLFSRLDAAISDFDESAESFGEDDFFYSGDIAEWVKLANSLKMRMAITLSDVDSDMAQTAIEEASPNGFTSNDDNALLNYVGAPPNTNPIWEDLVQSGRHDFVAANTVVDTMNYLEDPRRPEYFTIPTDSSEYVGGIYGASNNYDVYSHPDDKIKAPTFSGFLLTYWEVEFIRAEAVERGYNVSGAAAEHYSNGITASMEYWEVDDGDIATYLAQADVAYATAPGDYKAKIGLQKWLALYIQGMQAWTEWRRLDYPVLNVPPDMEYSDIPVRFTYPVSEENRNTSQYDQAAQNIGGDKQSTKVFWDVN